MMTNVIIPNEVQLALRKWCDAAWQAGLLDEAAEAGALCEKYIADAPQVVPVSDFDKCSVGIANYVSYGDHYTADFVIFVGGCIVVVPGKEVVNLSIALQRAMDMAVHAMSTGSLESNFKRSRYDNGRWVGWVEGHQP